MKTCMQLPFMAIALAILLAQAGCTAQKTATQATTAAPKAQSWAEKLGYPPGKIVLILHADDVGMCPEANAAAARQLLNDEIQSAAVMMPCPNAAEFIEWAKAHPQEDVGLHLTLTSEWKTYRWPPLSKPEEVPGLIDPDGMMWHTVFQVVMNASPEEVEKEIRAQIEKSLALGYRPSHIDTHMGTLYGSSKFTAVYLKVAEEYQIPAMVIDMRDPAVVAGFKAKGYPINEEMIELVNNYRLPKLDYFASTLNGSTYEEKRANFFKVVDELPPGLSEIIFHPSELTDNLKTITNSWQQRAWEAELFADPKVQQYLRQKGVIFTSWKEIMQRFRAR